MRAKFRNQLAQESKKLLHLPTKLELHQRMLQCLNKNLLYKTSSDASNDIKFIPYGLNTLTKKKTIREILIQQSVFLNEAKIVPVFGIMEPDNPTS